MAKAICKRCGQHIEYEPDMEGQDVICPGCENIIRLLNAESTPKAESEPDSKPTPDPLNPVPGSQALPAGKRQMVQDTGIPAKTPDDPVRAIEASSPKEKFGPRQILGLTGFIILFIGIFCPIVKIPIAGAVNYFQNGKGDGVFLIGFAAIALFGLFTGREKVLLCFSLCCLALPAFTLVSFQRNIKAMKLELGDGSGFGEAMANFAIQAIQIQWGFAILIIGSSLIIAPIFVRGRLETDPTKEYFRLSRRWRMGAAAVCVLFILAMLTSPLLPAKRLNLAESQTPKTKKKDIQTKQETWELASEVSPIDDSKTYILSRDANESIPSMLGPTKPKLFVRYKDGKLYAYVGFGTYLGSRDTWPITVRIGEFPAQEMYWDMSNSGKSLFFPGDASIFIEQLLQNNSLTLRTTPYGGSTYNCHFQPSQDGRELRSNQKGNRRSQG